MLEDTTSDELLGMAELEDEMSPEEELTAFASEDEEGADDSEYFGGR